MSIIKVIWSFLSEQRSYFKKSKHKILLSPSFWDSVEELSLIVRWSWEPAKTDKIAALRYWGTLFSTASYHLENTVSSYFRMFLATARYFCEAYGKRTMTNFYVYWKDKKNSECFIRHLQMCKNRQASLFFCAAYGISNYISCLLSLCQPIQTIFFFFFFLLSCSAIVMFPYY